MSLVNDMLRDLENRGQAQSITLGNEPIHSVDGVSEPRPYKKSGAMWWAASIGLIIGCLAFAWSYWQQMTPQEDHKAQVLTPVQSTDVATVLPSNVMPGLSLESVDWQTQGRGGVLVMRFDKTPQVHLINQTRDSVVISLPDVRLGNTLPLPEKEVVRGFNLMQDGDQLILDVEAVRDAHFELNKSTPYQLELVVNLMEPVSAKKQEPGQAVVVQQQEAPEAIAQATEEIALVPSVRNAEVAAVEHETPAGASDKGLSHPVDSAPREPANVRVTSLKQDVMLTDTQAVSKARKLLQRSRVDEAQVLLESQVAQSENVPESRALLASLYVAGGKVVQATDVADSGLERAPLHGGLKKIKARILLDQNDSAGAVELLERAPPAIKLDAEYHEILAAALQQQGRADDAVNVYYQLLKYNSGQARLWVGLGYSLELAARLDESRKAYESSLQVPGIEDNLKRYVTQRLSQLAER